MPAPIVPQDQWETEFEGPLPGEPGIASAFRTLIQRVLNRTEWLWARLSTHRSAPVLDHPDGSVTSAKLAPNSVDATKIVDGAVISTKIADGSISRTKIVDGEVITEKLADGAVTLQKLASNSVDTTKLVDGAVTSTKIANNSITRTKIVDGEIIAEKLDDWAVTYDKLAPNSVDATKLVDGAVTSTKIADGSISRTKIVDGEIITDKLANEAVTLQKLAPNSVDATKILDGAVTNTKIADNSISRTKIVDREIITEKLADGAVTSDKLASLAVTSPKISSSAVTTDKIADGAVTIPKLANVSVNPTPNTLALRNAQGAVQDGATLFSQRVLKAGGLYHWPTPNRWLRLVRWTGITGNWRGVFADLYIHRVTDQNIGTRLRARVSTDGSGALTSPNISIANDNHAIITNAILLQTGADTLELWAFFPWGTVYVSGVVATSIGAVELTPYGDVGALVQDTAPTPVPGGLYLEWNTATVGQTLLGPGYIVAASRAATSGHIRYDNGIQVCWATVSVGSGTWTYPAAFASTPRVLATAQDTVPRLATITSVSTTAAGVLRTDLSGTTQSGTVHLWAIGLWK